MKQPWEWNEDDLLALVSNSTKESVELDYKACDALAQTDRKKNEVSKDISAFANSAGGTIVYGMIENGHVPVRLDSGYDPSVISKEWLDQVINSRIQRRIDGVRINQVELTKTSPGKVAYVVYVPQSMRAPHQAADKRFYKRFNFESAPMEEYEVRDVSRRLIAPDVFLSVRLLDPGAMAVNISESSSYSQQVRLQFIVGNNSPAPADFCLLSYYKDQRCQLTCHSGSDNAIEFSGEAITVCSHIIEWRGNLRLPIWETTLFNLDTFGVSFPRNTDKCCFFWEAQAPLMARKMGVAILKIEHDTLSVSNFLADWKLQREVIQGV